MLSISKFAHYNTIIFSKAAPQCSTGQLVPKARIEACKPILFSFSNDVNNFNNFKTTLNKPHKLK